MLHIFSILFNFIVKQRNTWYDRNYQKNVHCDIPIISVGNLSVGGTGKTPFVIELCKIIKELGYTPCVIGRGYKRKSRNDILVSSGDEVLVDANVGGDEMVMIAKKAKVLVMTGQSKSYTAKYIDDMRASGDLTYKNIDCIIIDDGFQHRKLKRDLDIVLIDKATLDNAYLLPKGRLREPFSSLSRSDIICLTKGASSEKLLQVFPNSNKPIIETTFKLSNPYSLFSSYDTAHNVITVTGIAKPKYFIEMLNNENINIIYSIDFADHHNFSEKDVRHICEICTVRSCFCIAITEKDAVKLSIYEKIFLDNNITVLVYPLELNIVKGKEILIERIRSIL